MPLNNLEPDAQEPLEKTDEAGSQLVPPKARRTGRVFRSFWTFSFLAIATLGTLAYFAHRSTQTVPEFYRAALDIAPESYREAGEEFESRMLQLNTDVRNLDSWQASFSQDQVNGWLAFELPENFPGTIPPQVSEPRVAFFENNVQLAFHFVSSKFSGIITISGDVFCTENRNQIGIQIQSVRSGVIPLPMDVWAESIEKSCRKAGIKLMWSQKDGDTVAIVDLPDRFLDIKNRQIILESVEIAEGELLLSGQSRSTTSPADSQLPNHGESSSGSQFSEAQSNTRQR